MEKQYIEINTLKIGDETEEFTIEEILDIAEKEKKNLKSVVDKWTLWADSNFSDSAFLSMSFFRWETDSEAILRVTREKAREAEVLARIEKEKKAAEEQEYNQYLQLRQKFENKAP
jgi:HD superfamily phosphohydrolase